jgi:hypothetical protein
MAEIERYQPSVTGNQHGGKHVLVDEEVAHPEEKTTASLSGGDQKRRGRNNVPLGNDDVNAINALGQVNLLDLTLNQRDNCWPQRTGKISNAILTDRE